eukprot:TRINITY_DN2911_c0_g1_i2.p1 TRINITY_DN2911_c0_g1~~TRINITY_DN2911_c0_g1_i2.p1  ORF type:complete len:225 (-),score=24.01 TRINITY_DN2911_c0_g1_i2:99-773(-)
MPGVAFDRNAREVKWATIAGLIGATTCGIASALRLLCWQLDYDHPIFEYLWPYILPVARIGLVIFVAYLFVWLSIKDEQATLADDPPWALQKRRLVLYARGSFALDALLLLLVVEPLDFFVHESEADDTLNLMNDILGLLWFLRSWTILKDFRRAGAGLDAPRIDSGDSGGGGGGEPFPLPQVQVIQAQVVQAQVVQAEVVQAQVIEPNNAAPVAGVVVGSPVA